MSIHKCFRVIVNLTNFFQDHRSVARIFVKEENKTIEDLQNRISEIFGINSFYLTSHNQYLPPTEDVRVLDKDEIIWAIKNDNLNVPQSVEVPLKVKQKKKKKEREEIVDESPKRKKKKRRHVEIETEEKVSELEPCFEENSKEEEPLPVKRRKKKKNVEILNNVSDVPYQEKLSQKMDVIEENQENTKQKLETIKNKIRSSIESQKSPDKNENIIQSTSFLKPPFNQEKLNKFYNCKGNLSEYTKMSPIPVITDEYLNKKKTNIVKIDVVYKNDEQIKETTTENTIMDVETVSNGFVQAEIEKIERKLSSESNTSEENVEKVHNNTLEENVMEIIDSQPEKSADLTEIKPSEETLEIPQTLTVEPQEVTSTEPTITPHENSTENTPNNTFIRELNDASTVSSDTCDASSLVSFRSVKAKKTISGIGCLLENLRMSDCAADTDDSFVTKRRRKRVRKRKQKKRLDTPTIPPLVIRLAQPFVVAKPPAIHIKFEEEDDVKKEEEEPKKEASDEDDQKIELDFLFNEEYIGNAPEMKELQPKKGDLIAFKVLRITERYTPELSGYVVGRIDKISEDKRVSMEILNGFDQISPFNGEFCADSEESQVNNTKYREFDWNELSDPRLLFP